MPSTSKSQQKLMGMVHAAQTGQLKSPSAKVAKLAKTMSKKSAKDFASTKHKGLPTKVKNEMQYDNQIGSTYAVKKADKNCTPDSMVFHFDPVMGVSSTGIHPDSIYGLYPDEKTAQTIAEKVYKEFEDGVKKLEEKKGTVTTKLQKAIDKLEKQRKDHMKMAKDNPKEASTHKSHVEAIEGKIKNLMDKLEKVEKSKKPIEEVEDESKKEDIKENVDAVDFVTMDVPLFIRLLEYAKEDAQTDMDLHKVAENVISLSKSGRLNMSDYNNIVTF